MTRRKGFSLIELVVVILILGILAAVAAPKLFNTSAKATDNGLKQTLYVVRDAIELYAADNNGEKPGQTDDLPTDLEPYLRGAFPKCPVGQNDATIAYAATTPDPPVADATPTQSWKYYKDTGVFIVNSSDATVSDPATNYDQL